MSDPDGAHGASARSTASAPRLILANLGWEAELAAGLGLGDPLGDRPDSSPRLRRPHDPDRPHSLYRPPRRAAREAAAAAGSLLRAFAAEGDVLALPADLDPERLARLPGLPRPVLAVTPPGAATPEAVRGVAPDLSDRAPVLAWGAVDDPSPSLPEASADSPLSHEPLPGDALSRDPLHRRLWTWPRSPRAVAARCHHRAFALELAHRLGVALAGARPVASRAELDGAIAALGEIHGAPPAWVAKAPWAAAGRDRIVATGGLEGLAPNPRRHLEALLERHGELIVEPWMERLADYGAVGLVGEETGEETGEEDGDSSGASLVEPVGVHRLRVDDRGAFRGIELAVATAGLAGEGPVPEPVATRLVEVLRAVGRALGERGYRGPFGIDAFVYRSNRERGGSRGDDPLRLDGTSRLHPLVEINARMTFGLVARALVDRLAAAGGAPDAAVVRLAFGRQPPETAGVRVLLTPVRDGTGRGGVGRGGAAWLEPMPDARGD